MELQRCHHNPSKNVWIIIRKTQLVTDLQIYKLKCESRGKTKKLDNLTLVPQRKKRRKLNRDRLIY